MLRRSKNRRTRTRTPVPSPRSRQTPRARFPVARTLLSVLAIGAIAAVLGGGVWLAHRWLTHSRHFAVSVIRVSPTRHLSADAVRARSGIALGTNLFAVRLDEVAARLHRDPWIASVRVHRELPQAIAVEVVEREVACAVALESIYLADSHGSVFKHASPDEAAALPVITGISRDGYVHDREASESLVREGLAALASFRSRPRFAVGEIHVDQGGGTTIYSKDALAVRLGRGDERTLRARLERLDAVLAAMVASGEHAALIDVDHRVHPDRVTVRLSRSAPPSDG